MRSRVARMVASLLAGLAVTAAAAGDAARAQATLPNPVLVFVGQESVQTGGKQVVRYRYAVDNSDAYPNAMFAASPQLPPCGANTKSARTWVTLYDQSGKLLQGFCAIGSSAGLGQLWFALDAGVVPPSWVYVELHDRQTDTKYKSNLADTVL